MLLTNESTREPVYFNLMIRLSVRFVATLRLVAKINNKHMPLSPKGKFLFTTFLMTKLKHKHGEHHIFGLLIRSFDLQYVNYLSFQNLSTDIMVFPQHFWSICHFDFSQTVHCWFLGKSPKRPTKSTQRTGSPPAPTEISRRAWAWVWTKRGTIVAAGETVDDADISRRFEIVIKLGGGFKDVLFSSRKNWGTFPFWLIFFKWVETTN